METLVLALVILFVAYRVGLIALTQSAIETGKEVAEEFLTVSKYGSKESTTKKLGKIKVKLQDDTITRSTAKELDSILGSIGK